MREIRIADTANGDLKAIRLHVAQDNSEAATRLIKEITQRFSLLRDNPLMGRQQDYLLISLRSFTVRGYMIFYQPFENGIDILRILHSSRDVETIFERFFENL